VIKNLVIRNFVPAPSTGDKEKDWERETTCRRQRGRGWGRSEKAWSSLNHSILSDGSNLMEERKR
jgi:hypothetical protein